MKFIYLLFLLNLIGYTFSYSMGTYVYYVENLIEQEKNKPKDLKFLINLNETDITKCIINTALEKYNYNKTFVKYNYNNNEMLFIIESNVGNLKCETVDFKKIINTNNINFVCYK